MQSGVEPFRRNISTRVTFSEIKVVTLTVAEVGNTFSGGLGELGPQDRGRGGAPRPSIAGLPQFRDAREPASPLATPFTDTEPIQFAVVLMVFNRC
jgi:hypothetical protein